MDMKRAKEILPGLLLVCVACGTEPAAPPSVPADVSPKATPAISRPVSSADVVKASVADAEITAGGSIDAKVLIAISQGYHINANPPTFRYLIPTAVEIAESKDITSGKPVYPAPVTKKFSFAEKPLSVYEGETAIKITLQATGDAGKGLRKIPIALRVQACDDSVCYAPAKIDLALHLTVK